MEFIDLKAQYRALQPEIDGNISRILAGARFIGGPEVTELEEKLAAYVGRKHCVTCGNGTDALHLAYMAYGIGPGDAVFCPDMTFIASVEPACMMGASPVFCDIEPDTYNLCPASLEAHIRAVLAEGKLRPRAVVAVDFLGNPAKFDEIAAICRKDGLLLIEDAGELDPSKFEGAALVGITAGASTPGWIIKEVRKNMSDEIMEIEDFYEAVHAAADRAERGDVVLLSPASAAFDKFKNFMVRGAEFKKTVMEL